MSPRLSLLAAVALGCALMFTSCTGPRAGRSAPDALASLTYDGDQQSLVALDHAIAAAQHDSAKLRALATRLLAILHAGTATPAARQAAAQRLSLFSPDLLTAPENEPRWLALTASAEGVTLFRLALDRAPGPEIDALFLSAFDRVAPAQRLGLIQSFGCRRIAAAVPKLAPLLDDTDADLAKAAATALGEIGTPAAIAALKESRRHDSPEFLQARLAVIQHLAGPAGLAESQAIVDTPTAPAALRSAALLSLLAIDPETAATRLTNLLTSSDGPAKAAVLTAIPGLNTPDLVPTLIAHLAALDAATQVAVVAGLGRRVDPAALPAVTALTACSDASVRAAAITALAWLPGSPAVVTRLAQIAAGVDAADAKLARQTLALLTGPQVASTITAGATNAERPLRLVFIDALAARNTAEAVPLLLQMRTDPDAGIRAAALSALTDLAPPTEQAAILAWTLAATDTAEQGRALRALVAVTLRNPDTARRSDPVVAAIAAASDVVAQRLLPALPRLGDATSAACTTRLALRELPALATAATTALGRWTDPVALEPLVHLAEVATVSTTRSAAAAAAVLFLQRTRNLPSSEFRALTLRLIACAPDLPTRRRLVYLLGRGSDQIALDELEPFKSDPALATEAADAEQSIRANLAGRPTLRTSANAGQTPNLIDDDSSSTWNVPALATQWIEFTFPASRPFRQIVVDGGRNQLNFPEHLDVYVTDDLAQPGSPFASVGGHVGRNVIDLPATAHGRYLIIRHSKERADAWWTVAEITWD